MKQTSFSIRNIPAFFRAGLHLVILASFAFPLSAFSGDGGEKTYQLRPHADMAAFLKDLDESRSDPGRVAALFVLAMLTTTENQALGEAQLTALLSENQLTVGRAHEGKGHGVSMRAHIKRLLAKPYVARSYFRGTTPAKGYELPAEGLAVVLNKDPLDAGDPNRVKFFIRCSGADSPRPITMKKEKDGAWKAAEVSSLFVGIRPPEK